MAGIALAVTASNCGPNWQARAELLPEDIAAQMASTNAVQVQPVGDSVIKDSSHGESEARGELAQKMPAKPLESEVLNAARAHALPADFFKRLIWQESRFKPHAVSRAGAMGIAQFMPGTAQWRGLSDPFNPTDALHESARWLRELWGEFGNLGLAAAAYNAGPGRVSRWLAGRASLPAETREYVQIITGEPAERWSGCAADVAMKEGCPPLRPQATSAPKLSSVSIVSGAEAPRPRRVAALPQKGATLSDIDAGPWAPGVFSSPATGPRLGLLLTSEKCKPSSLACSGIVSRSFCAATWPGEVRRPGTG